MFELKPCDPPSTGSRVVLKDLKLCGYDEPVTYELLTELNKSPLYIEVMLARSRDDSDSKTIIGRIVGNRLAITVSNPSGTVTTTNQARHQIVYLPERNLQLTFGFCCVPIAAGKFLFYHEFHEEQFVPVPES